jgi:hypothetical protein
MKTIETKVNLGPCTCIVTVQADEKMQAEFLLEGARSRCHRAVASTAFSGQDERDKVPFETAKAGLLAAFEKAGMTAVITPRVKAEQAASRKRATALYEAAKAKGRLEKFAEVLDYDGDVNDAEAMIEAIHDMAL